MTFEDHYTGLRTLGVVHPWNQGNTVRDGVVVDDQDDYRSTSRAAVEKGWNARLRTDHDTLQAPVQISYKCRHCPNKRFACQTARDLHEKSHT